MELTPEEIAMTFDLKSDSVENPIEVLVKLIREYGEQQYTKGYATSFEDRT